MIDKALNHLLSPRALDVMIKSAICLVFVFFIYTLVSDDKSLDDTYSSFKGALDPTNIYLIGVVVIVMSLNWWVESLKWKRLLSPITNISLKNSIHAVLVGLAMALFTPNRIGEYLGRAWMAPIGLRWQATGAQMLGSFVQMALISMTGVLSLLYLFDSGGVLPILPDSWLLMVFAFLGFLALLAYFHAGAIINWFYRCIPYQWFGRLIQPLDYYSDYKRIDLFIILLLTLVRLQVYTFQYFLLLRFFGIDIDWQSSVAAILACYCIQTAIPVPPFIALLARGEIALLIWDYFDVNELSILAASYCLWVINVLIPSLVGMIFVLKMDILKSMGYDST